MTTPAHALPVTGTIPPEPAGLHGNRLADRDA